MLSPEGAKEMPDEITESAKAVQAAAFNRQEIIKSTRRTLSTVLALVRLFMMTRLIIWSV
jgi:hypothetical protein